ncbi:response regulator transcription factor [Pacificimonas sp. ICDLI1SI03]
MNPAFPTNVYIVDDDAEVRRSSWFMLSEAGFEPRGFMSGADFLDELDDLPTGVVLLDLNMPDVNGFDVLKAMAAPQSMPVIVVTGFGDVSRAVRAMKLGATDFIEKPYDDAEMIDLINAAIEAHKDVEEDRRRRLAARQKLSELTDREREVLDLLLAGLPNKLVAHRLQLSLRTVEMHRANMMSRLGAPSFAAAMRLALSAGREPPVLESWG